jgi:hypothetical protein
LERKALPAAYRSARVDAADIPSKEEADKVIFHFLSLVWSV